MKNIKVVTLLLGVAVMLSSCASSKKYSEALASQKNLQQQYNDLQQKYNKLEQQAQASASSQDEISKKQADLQKEEESLKDMKEIIQEQRDAINNLKQEVCDAVKCFTPDQLTVEVKDGKLYIHMADKLLFPTGSDAVNSEGKKAIEDVAKVLAKSDLEIMVEGHTDDVPIHNAENRDNWDLSVRRATSVTRIFIKDGIDPARIIAAGRSKFLPVASNSTTTGRQDNRRTEIVLQPKLDKLWKLTEQSTTASGL